MSASPRAPVVAPDRPARILEYLSLGDQFDELATELHVSAFGVLVPGQVALATIRPSASNATAAMDNLVAATQPSTSHTQSSASKGQSRGQSDRQQQGQQEQD
jgi:hypothetical protein